MTKLIFAFLFNAILALGVMAQAKTLPHPLQLGEVKQRVSGCGCTFSRNLEEEKKRRHFYVGNFDEAPLINLDGKDVKLTPVARSEKNVKPKVGDRMWETYTIGSMKVRLEKVVNKLCDADDASCEVVYYDATLTVTQGTNKSEVKLIGLCGC